MFSGWLRHKNHRDSRVSASFAWEAKSLQSTYSAALWAMEKRLAHANAAVAGKVRRLRFQIGDEFGLGSRLWAHLIGPLLLWSSKHEDKRSLTSRLPALPVGTGRLRPREALDCSALRSRAGGCDVVDGVVDFDDLANGLEAVGHVVGHLLLPHQV
jgi:hypothetical protein